MGDIKYDQFFDVDKLHDTINTFCDSLSDFDDSDDINQDELSRIFIDELLKDTNELQSLKDYINHHINDEEQNVIDDYDSLNQQGTFQVIHKTKETVCTIETKSKWNDKNYYSDKTLCKWGDECEFWKKGKCKYDHSIVKKPLNVDNNANTTPCKWGNNCRFLKTGNCKYSHHTK